MMMVVVKLVLMLVLLVLLLKGQRPGIPRVGIEGELEEGLMAKVEGRHSCCCL